MIISKAVVPQLGWGMSGQCPSRPPCRSVRPPGRQPGLLQRIGGGCWHRPTALGADTGGSVRLAASSCGVVGFKPEQAAVSRVGLAVLTPELDAVGCLAAPVDDCQLVHEALVEGTSTCHVPADDVEGAADPGFLQGIADEVKAAFEREPEALKAAGVQLAHERLPSDRLPLGALYAAALAQHFGYLFSARPELFGEDLKAGVAAGRVASARHIREGWATRARLRRDAALSAHAFDSPASPILPPSLEAQVNVAAAGGFLRPLNVLDWPAIVMPCPHGDLPAGLQPAAPRGSDHELFALAKLVEAGG